MSALQLEVVARADAAAWLACTVRFLQAAEHGRTAEERALAPRACSLEELELHGLAAEFENDPRLVARVEISAERFAPERVRVRVRVESRTPLGRDEALAMDRHAALLRSLSSTHVVLRLAGGTFVSPLERAGADGAVVRACANVNTWPVLSGASDDAILGAATLLADHPELLGQPFGGTFDDTGIEDALLLNIQTLNREDRAAIAAEDPRIADAIQRALARGTAELDALHGFVRPAAPFDGARGGSRVL